MKRTLLVAALLLSAPAWTPAWADEIAITLKPGPGMETTAASCAACHSLDYIQMNATFMNADTWKAEVAKMRNIFKAQIEQDVADEITNYLIKAYGVPPK